VQAAEDRTQHLRALFGNMGYPAVDMAIQGVEEDGYAASLFPGSQKIKERDRGVASAFRGD
jgi:hypothetical protein